VITKLNLATYPFRNRTLPYVASGLLLIISLVVGVFCLAKLNSNRNQNQILAADVKERQAEIDRLKGEGEKVQQMLTPDQKAILVAAHKLVANKAFSWSRLFADLESVLPGSVSTSRIAVQNVYMDGDRVRAELELAVISRDYPAVMAMIDNMNNSGLFQAELRGQDLQKNDRVTFTEYTFRIIYTPGYGYSTAPATDVAQNADGGAR
jgi:Tfp pilus assembly protein PilN